MKEYVVKKKVIKTTIAVVKAESEADAVTKAEELLALAGEDADVQTNWVWEAELHGKSKYE